MSNKPSNIAPGDVDPELNRLLDKTMGQTFIGKADAFLGSLLGSSDVHWSRDIPTAATDGVSIWINPEFFQHSPQNLRNFALVHELWHIGRLHPLRRGNREPEPWNWACDYVINQDMVDSGHSFAPFPALLEPAYKGKSEEEIYELLMQNGAPMVAPGIGDLIGGGSITPADEMAAINKVVTAVQSAHMGNQAGSIPGGIKEIINKFLKPIVPWQKLLNDFFQDLQDSHYSWARPNRRYPDIYLPSRLDDDGRLESLNWYIDVSGSITTKDELRFSSELKHVLEHFKPKMITVIQFDTRIQKVDVFNDGDPFDEIEIVGRGGTSLVCVREHIEQTNPTAAIVFSDLYCEPMEKLSYDVPVIWVVVNHAGAGIPFGKKIHINN